MEQVDEGKVSAIIVKDMSRLGRDYLKVGMYTEMIFPNADIRFIAINNGVDSKNFDDRFIKLSETYEAGQTGLKDRITELQDFIDHEQEAAVNTDSFIRLVRKYTDVQELNSEIIREFVDKIYIYKAERIGGKKVQHIKILWNCIGEFIPPVNEKTA